MFSQSAQWKFFENIKLNKIIEMLHKNEEEKTISCWHTKMQLFNSSLSLKIFLYSAVHTICTIIVDRFFIVR